MKLSDLRRGIDTRRRRLAHWVPVVRAWQRIHENYSKQIAEDLIHYQNERCNLSALSGAAWQCGWIALEEFAQEKEGGARSGRADLWLRSKDEEHEDFVEAKAADIPSGCRDPKGAAEYWLGEACKAAGKVKRDRTTRDLVGLAFLRVRVPPSRGHQVQELALTVLPQILGARCDLAFWVFPAIARRLQEEDYLYPGVVALAQVVKPKR